jgi:hypothetical protein
MQQTPPPGVLSYNQGGTNHTFAASEEICSECHESITAEEVESVVESEMELLEKTLYAAIKAQIEAQLDAGAKVALGGDVITPSHKITVSGWGSSRGRQAVTVTADDGVDPVVSYSGRINGIEFDGVDFSGTSEQAQVIVKSGWNYMMALNDKSHGIHNAEFVNRMLGAAQSRMNLTDFTAITKLP